MRTPLGRVLGLGSARAGTETFWRQRLSSLALVPLAVFAVALVVTLSGQEQAAVIATLARVEIALPLLLLLVVTAYHMKLGMQEIIEDYVHAPAIKLLATLGNLAFSAVVAAIAVFAVLKLAFGA